MKLKVLLSVTLIAMLLAGCTTPPNGTAIVLQYPDDAAELGQGDGSRGVGTTTVRALNVINDTTVGGTLTVTGGVTGANVLTTGDQTAAGVKTWSGAAIFSGATSAAGLVTGTAGATIAGAAVNLNVASNFATNINTGNSNGAITLGGNSGTVAVNSSDWDISTAGAMTGIGAITADGVVAANAGITVDTTAFTVADTSGNVATAGTLSVGGGYGDTGCSVSAAGILQCNGAATIGGAMTVSGALNSVVPVLTKDANYPVVVADSGAIIKNTSVLSATFTLPAAAAGLNYCVFNYSGGDVIIEFTDSADVAINEVNSAGDAVTNSTAMDSICLTAIDAINWATISSLGTWADGTP